MGKRLELHSLLKELLETENVYFQPPASIKMVYPCLVYARNSGDGRFANDALYVNKTRYEVTVIDKDPDSPLVDKLANLPMCIFNRHFTADNLNHDTFYLYY